MLNQVFILRKIKLIQEDLARLESLKDLTLEALGRDAISYAAMERLLERIVTRAIDINRHVLAELGSGREQVKTYEDTFMALSDLGIYPADFGKEIAPSAGLRNVLVHEYDQVDITKVYQSAAEALEQYAAYCDFLLKLVDKQEQQTGQ